MRYPLFIRSGDPLGFIAPSFGCSIEPYKSCLDNALIYWRNEGYNTLTGPNAYAGKGVGISNVPEECAKEFCDFYTSGNNKALLSVGGGELMCEILPFIDFDKIRSSDPKWFMGYSDNTNITYLLTTLCDVASVYGPCAQSFGMEPLHDYLKDAKALLEGTKLKFTGYDRYEKESLKSPDNPLAPVNATEPRKITVFDGQKFTDNKVSFKGRLLGGCLDCLVNLLGTRFDKTEEFIKKYSGDGIVWFIESCELNPFEIRRALWQMDNAGWFEGCAGILIGRPGGTPDFEGFDHIAAYKDGLKHLNVPIILDIDLGHVAPQIPFVCGALGQVEAMGQNMSVEYILK
ncbi:MAG: LD-carboxypeptidase [Clostridiales bacterium]|nr:LD-carboxypeptidase [Clostridiales bacterium]